MLVAGSQVALTEYRTLNSGLRGRFGVWRLGPLSLDDGAELALRLARRHDLAITAKSAYEVSRLAGGHPFYIDCLVRSPAPGKDLRPPEGLAAVAEYEVKQGEIYRFWQEHFEEQAGLLAQPKIKPLLFALLEWEAKTSEEEKKEWGGASYKELAAEVGLEPEETWQLLRRLRDADLLEQGGSAMRFRGLPDPLMEQCLRLNYGDEVWEVSKAQLEAEATQHFRTQIAALERTVASLRGHLRELLGRVAEVAVQRVMKQGFRDQTVAGAAFFHRDEPIPLPRFRQMKADHVVTAGGEEYQLDNVGLPERPERHATWVTEQKNWDQRVGLYAARKFSRAVAAYQAGRGCAPSGYPSTGRAEAKASALPSPG